MLHTKNNLGALWSLKIEINEHNIQMKLDNIAGLRFNIG